MRCSEASLSLDLAQAYLPLSRPRTVTCSGVFDNRSSMNASKSALRRAPASLSGGAAAQAYERSDAATAAPTTEPAARTNWRRSITGNSLAVSERQFTRAPHEFH